VGDEGVGVVEFAVGPQRDAAASAGVADLVSVAALALVVVIGFDFVGVRGAGALLEIPFVENRVGNALEPAVEAAVFGVGPQGGAVDAEGDEVVFPGEVVFSLGHESGDHARFFAQVSGRQGGALEIGQALAAFGGL